MLLASVSFSQDKATTRIVLTDMNTVNMNNYFEDATVAELLIRVKLLDNKVPANSPFYLVMNSGGGSITAGLEFIENLLALNRPVNTITLWSASMAFQTVQALGERYILDTGTLMSHKAKGGFSGEFPGQLDSRYNFWLRKIETLDKKTVARTKGKHTVQSYNKLIENEYWCDGDDCLKQGFADQIAKVTCDHTLEGTREDVAEKFSFMGHKIEIMFVTARCPTITGILDYNIYIDGKPMFKRSTFGSRSINTLEFSYFNSRDFDFLQEKAEQRINDIESRKVKLTQ
jgi:ATP-dependent protease ClpP protease subunit